MPTYSICVLTHSNLVYLSVVYLTAVLSKLYVAQRLLKDKCMMNWKGFGKNTWWPNFKELSQHYPGGAEEIHEELHSE
jgi:hypothetical protein